MTSEHPLVSVLMPMRDAAAFLPAAMDSLLGQKFRGFEVIGVDDGSTDATAHVFRDLADDRCRLVEGRAQGISAALNLAAQSAAGSYLARMDADDECTPDRLVTQVAMLEQDPSTVCVASAFTVIDEAGRPLRSQPVPLDDLTARAMLVSHNPYCHGSAVIRRTAFEAVGGYQPADEPAEDYAMWVRLAEHGRLAASALELYRHRTHGALVSQTRDMQQRAAAARIARVARVELSIPVVDGDAVVSAYARHRDASPAHAKLFETAARELVVDLGRRGRRREMAVVSELVRPAALLLTGRQRRRHRMRLVKALVLGAWRRRAGRSTSRR
jgi:glycosyltransferase involved in cell wall biosynthesis